MERMYIASRLWTRLTSGFLEQVACRYHYEKKDMEQLRRVASDMAGCLKGQESTYLVFPERTDRGQELEDLMPESSQPWKTDEGKKIAGVVMTLGARIDRLQERYQQTDRMLESYMVENIGGELLMQGYGQMEEWIWDWTGCRVAAYHFPGEEEDYPLELMPELLTQACRNRVRCNAGFCLEPKMSVAFFVELTEQGTGACASICDTCSRRDTCVRQQVPEEGDSCVQQEGQDRKGSVGCS